MKDLNLEAGLSAVWQTQQHNESKEDVSKFNKPGIKDCKYCGRDHDRRKCPPFGQICRKCGVKNHFAAKCQVKNKVATVQDKDRFYMGITKMGANQVRETVTLTMLKEEDGVPNVVIQFLMDTGAECNVLPLSVYQDGTGDAELRKLDKNKCSVLVLANGYEQPIEGRSTKTHKLVVNVVKGPVYEPILCKQTLIDVGMIIAILDSDQNPRVNALTSGCNSLLQEFEDVFNGLGKLEGQYTIVIDQSVKSVVHPPRRLPVAFN